MFRVQITQQVILILFLEFPKTMDFFQHACIMVAIWLELSLCLSLEVFFP